MLKTISQPFCCGALNACRDLQVHLLKWLCDPSIAAADITNGNLRPPIVPTQIEADWLWRFLYGRKQTRLNQAKLIAGMVPAEKQVLLDWAATIVDVANQFQLAPTRWPIVLPIISAASWSAFKDLMEAFYDRGLRSGLPYKSDGTPVATGGVCYADYVEAFRTAHRLNPNPNASEVCVICGGPLGDTPHVDHWIIKSAFPLLSLCSDNLTVICATCNEAPNKGDKSVCSHGSFVDWFHPHLRPGGGAVLLNYVSKNLSVQCNATVPSEQPKAANLDALFNLSSRWTRVFKSEYLNLQDTLIQREKLRVRRSQPRHTEADVRAYIQQLQDDLLPSKPHFEVNHTLVNALQEQQRIDAWLTELALIT